jgi:hypothetical protein
MTALQYSARMGSIGSDGATIKSHEPAPWIKSAGSKGASGSAGSACDDHYSLAPTQSTVPGPSCNLKIGGGVGVLHEGGRNDKKKDQHDKAVEDSFPASDPPAATGITRPRVSTPKTEELDDQDKQQKNE